MARSGETSRGVGLSFLERLLGELVASSPAMVKSGGKRRVCQAINAGTIVTKRPRAYLIRFHEFQSFAQEAQSGIVGGEADGDSGAHLLRVAGRGLCRF
jgi:hypothetical protein